MGDPNRHIVFTKFINKNFPKAETLLCVADGKGVLARKLANKRKSVVVIENKPRFAGRNHKRIIYQKGWFDRNFTIEIDTVVGMHPDEATSEIILFAKKNKVPFAVVPCCCLGYGSSGLNRNNYLKWLKILKTMAGGCRETPLKMRGKNIVLYKHNW